MSGKSCRTETNLPLVGERRTQTYRKKKEKGHMLSEVTESSYLRMCVCACVCGRACVWKRGE